MAGTSAKDQTKVRRVRSLVVEIMPKLFSAGGAAKETVGVMIASTSLNILLTSRVQFSLALLELAYSSPVVL